MLLPLGSPGLLADRPWAIVVAGLTLLALLPPVLNLGIGVALRLLAQPALARPLTTRELLRPLAWLGFVWLAFGAATAVVAAPLAPDAPPATLAALAIGGFTLAWAVGVLVIPAPAGVGARVVALVLALSPLLTVTQATSVAVVLRVAHTGSDLLLAAGYRLVGRSFPRRG